MKQSTVRLAAFFRLDLPGCTRRVALAATMQSASTPRRRTRQQDRVIAVATAAPGWVAGFVDDDAEDGMWVTLFPSGRRCRT